MIASRHQMYLRTLHVHVLLLIADQHLRLHQSREEHLPSTDVPIAQFLDSNERKFLCHTFQFETLAICVARDQRLRVIVMLHDEPLSLFYSHAHQLATV